MSVVTLGLALLGFLSPSSRGSLVTVAVAFYVCFGFASGYTSARLYKMFGGEARKLCVFLSASLLPGTISLIVVLLNFFLIGAQSSAAIPFGTLAGLLALWILVSSPLCAVGAFVGFRSAKVEYPVRTNQIHRQIPPQPVYLHRIPSILLGGTLPFAVIFIESFFVMKSIWFGEFYYLFGFLFPIFLILLVVCAQVTILLCYFHLRTEDYRWWWRSFFTSGSAALYILAYSIFFSALHVKFSNAVSVLLYFGWMLMACVVFFVMTGSIGFLSCLWFTLKIYGAIKID
jgi:transmembrane 9 superfamily protein 2/4